MFRLFWRSMGWKFESAVGSLQWAVGSGQSAVKRGGRSMCKFLSAESPLPTAHCKLPTIFYWLCYEKKSLLRKGAISNFPIIPGLVSHRILGD